MKLLYSLVLTIGLWLWTTPATTVQERRADYWRGWCAGRQAGLEDASLYADTLLGDVRRISLEQEAMDIVSEIDQVLQMMAVAAFGPLPDTPVLVKQAEELRVSCPEGRLLQRPSPSK